MGWSSGSRVANKIWDCIRPMLPPEHRREAADKIIRALEDCDWDTQPEAPLLMADAGLDIGEHIGKPEGRPCGKETCGKPSAWKGVVGNFYVTSCHRHVFEIDGPEMI